MVFANNDMVCEIWYGSLTLTTRRLCRDGLVEPTIPPQVEYELTEMGRSLAATVFGLADWARDHKDAVAESRQQWDAQHPDR